MSGRLWVAERKGLVSELDEGNNQCHTCWPQYIFSQGSVHERKVYCCSHLLKADGDQNIMTSPKREDELFSGVRFLLAGFDPAYESQFIEELENNGGYNVEEYDSSCTHVIVSDLTYDDPICAAARKDGKVLVTDAWVADCLDTDTLADFRSVLYRPVRNLDGIPGSKFFCICLTGYQGQARQRVMRMVELMGAKFTKPLACSEVTHLICYKFEGDKYEIAKKTGLNLVNHFWLEDCLDTWSLLPESDYACSGWEAEQQAKQPKVLEKKSMEHASPATHKEIRELQGNMEQVRSFVSALSSKATEGGTMCRNGLSNASETMSTTKIHLSPYPSPSGIDTRSKDQLQRQIEQADAATSEDLHMRKEDVMNKRASHGDFKADLPKKESEEAKEAYVDVRQQEETSDLQMEELIGNDSVRRSSIEGANHSNHAASGAAGVVEPVKLFATMDCAMELLNISTDPASERRVGGSEERPHDECTDSREEQDNYSPENKRRRVSSSDSKLKLVSVNTSPSSSKGRQLLDSSTTSMVAEHDRAANEKVEEGDSSTQEEDLGISSHLTLPNNEDPYPMEETFTSDQVTSPEGNVIEHASSTAMQDEKFPCVDKHQCPEESSECNEVRHPPEHNTERIPEFRIRGTVARGDRTTSTNFPCADEVEVDTMEKVGPDSDKTPAPKRARNRQQGSAKSHGPVRHSVSLDEQDKENIECKEIKQGSQPKTGRETLSTKSEGQLPRESLKPPLKKCFAVGGTTEERSKLHYIIQLLGGKICKNRYQWRDEATHVIIPLPLRRTEKFLAGAAAGRWILKPEYLEASKKAGKFLDEETYEWYGEGTNDKGSISLQAPRKWRTIHSSTGCGAFYGLRVLVYGECISPPVDTLKRAIKAGGGLVIATTPPYTRHWAEGMNFAIISPGIPEEDEWVQLFLRHRVACVTSDFFVDIICHPFSPRDKHVLYNTHPAVIAAEEHLQKSIAQFPTSMKFTGPSSKPKPKRSASNKNKQVQGVCTDTACVICRRTDGEEVMLLCGNDDGAGCGLATHIHCCSPPLPEVPKEDWFCGTCREEK